MNLQRVARATLEVPAAEVDLGSWLFALSDEEYQACARGHHGAGVIDDEGGRGMVNVESIGGNLIVQHYRPVRAERAQTEMFSAASKVFLLHLVPVVASVCWTLALAPQTASSSELTCTVRVDLHPALRVMAGCMAAGMFLGRHLNEETQGFAADITRKHRKTRIRMTFADDPHATPVASNTSVADISDDCHEMSAGLPRLLSDRSCLGTV